MRSNQKGFSIIEVLLVVVILTMVGFVGYYVYSHRQSTNVTVEERKTQVTNDSATANDVAKAPSSINSTADLDKAASTLDSTDVSSSSDLDSLDSQLSGF